jgi:hypothetical protein
MTQILIGNRKSEGSVPNLFPHCERSKARRFAYASSHSAARAKGKDDEVGSAEQRGTGQISKVLSSAICGLDPDYRLLESIILG